MARTAARGFYTVGGERVPSVTTVIGTNLGWDKNALIAWARKQGLAGIDPYKVRDEAGSIGTLTHLMIQRLVMPSSEAPFQINLDEWTAEQQSAARRGVEAFLGWKSLHSVETIATEKSLVSEQYEYGGTLDWIATLDGSDSYMDFKTSKGIFPGHKIQVAAYLQLWHEATGVWLKPHILHLNKEDGSFSDHPLTGMQLYWEAFQYLLALNRLKKQLDP